MANVDSWLLQHPKPAVPPFQIETKTNFVSGLCLIVFAQPPLFNSAWQFEHHGAERWTTVTSGSFTNSPVRISTDEAASLLRPSARKRMRI